MNDFRCGAASLLRGERQRRVGVTNCQRPMAQGWRTGVPLPAARHISPCPVWCDESERVTVSHSKSRCELSSVGHVRLFLRRMVGSSASEAPAERLRPEHVQPASSRSCWPMAHRKPASSRATAITATGEGLPFS